MGTRQLQKAQRSQQQQLEPHGAYCSESSSENGDVDDNVAFNPFAFLGDGDSQEGEQDEEGHNDGKEPDEEVQEAQPVLSKPAGQATKAKQKNKKKRQPGAPGAGQSNRQNSVDIDAALQELGINPDKESTQAVQHNKQQAVQTAVLSIQAKMLNPDEELRAMFGSAVIALEQSERQQQAQQQGRNPHARQRGRKPQGRPKLLSRPANFPPADGLLTMQSHGANGGQHTHFQLTASSAYRTATMHFKQAQASMDPNNIAAVLAAHPFHIESLLAMCDLHTTTGQAEYGGAMLNRALYALESAWHIHFKAAMLAGTAWLPYDEGVNNLMFGALNRRVHSLARQGVHRTALEWAKLILALDTDDPCGMLFHIDYFCLRSREYSYIPELMHSFKGLTVLSLLPNYAFSSALASYYLSKADATVTPDTATGVHEPGSQPELDVALITAICSFPAALVELVKTMQDKGAATSAAWKAVMSKEMFKSPVGTDSATLMHLSRIFAARHEALWRAPDALAWLLRCAETSVSLVEDPEGSKSSVHESMPAFEDLQALIGMTYPASTENAFQHVSLTQFSESAAVPLPPDQLQEAGVADRAQAEAIVGGLMAGTGELSDDELQAANPIMALLHTLLPWVRVSGGQQDQGTAQRATQVLAQIPGLEGYLEQHGVQLGAQVSQEDRLRLVELVHQYITQLQQQ